MTTLGRMNTKPIDSVNSWSVRLPITTIDDLKWIQENMTDQLTKPSYSRIMEKAVKKMRREMERKQ